MCFGDFCDFFIAFKGGHIYKLFPETLPDRLFNGPRIKNPLLQFEDGSVQHAAYVRMMCIWTLYESKIGVITAPSFVESQIPYMIGIAMDAHIGIILNTKINSIHHIYKQSLAPEQKSLIEHSKNQQCIWTQEMATPDRIKKTMELLWLQEITIVFGSQRMATTTTKVYPPGKQIATIQSDVHILKKGLPRPTSIRYISTQMTRGLDQCYSDIENGVPSRYPCVLMMLMLNYLGAYKHSVSIAHPDARIKAYSLTSVSDILTLVGKSLTSSQLYNIVAEFIIAWSNEYSSLVHLLRRISFWKEHTQSVIWQCNYVMQPLREICSHLILKNVPLRVFSLVPLRKRLTQTYEVVNTKNIMYFLYKGMSIRKRIPKTIFVSLKAKKLSVKHIYKTALFKTRRINIDESVLHKMGISQQTLSQIQTIICKNQGLRASKVASEIIACFVLPHERSIFHLYLHALREQSQFGLGVVYCDSNNNTPKRFMLCISCLSLRSKAKGEKKSNVRNSGISIELSTHVAYCSSCGNTDLCPVDLNNRVLQLSNVHIEKQPARIVVCSGCECAVYTSSITIENQSVYCQGCIKKKHIRSPHDVPFLCGCIPFSYRYKKGITYTRIVAYTKTGEYKYYHICDKHISSIPTGVFSVESIKSIFVQS